MRPHKLSKSHPFSAALFATTLLVAAALAQTQAPAKKTTEEAIPSILKQVEATYAKAGTVIAHFDQTNESVALHTQKKSSGDIAIKRPNKLRWQTTQPDPNLLVSDGKKAWYYTPPLDPNDQTEHGQYSEYPASRIQSKLANALLSGEFSSAKDLKIEQTNSHEFHLTPKAGAAGTVAEAWVEIDPAKKVITRVRLLHRDGNRSDIHLSEIRLGEKLGDDVFVFKAPPGTEKLQD